MKIKLLLFYFFFLCFIASFAGEKDSLKVQPVSSYNYNKAPSIGYNMGYLNLFGDVKIIGYQPSLSSRLGHQFYVSFPLSNSFAISYNFFAGKIVGEETRGTNNLNFRTSLVGQSLMFEYNFHNIFNPEYGKKFTVLPYVGFGIQALVFRAKADMQNTDGATYYYWSDGSIKNLPETSGNIDLADIIERDYTYETELRDANLDGFGKYSQITFTMPFSLGVDFKTGKNLSFRLGATYHLTFSDMLDNLSSKGIGDRKGDEGNDIFLFSSLGVSYKFSAPKGKKEKPVDTDEDGIADLFDKCRDTPKGVKVDKNGCPEINEKDRDGDGVMDVVDRCRDTKPGDAVDKEGCSEVQKADADGDGIMNALDKCADTPLGSKVDAQGCPVEEKIVEQVIPEPVDTIKAAEITPPEIEVKPVEVKGVMEVETRVIEAKGELYIEQKPTEPKSLETKNLDPKYHFADLNKNGKIEKSELDVFINRMEKGDKSVPIKLIDEILIHYFNQE